MAALFWYEKEQVLHIEDFVPQTACRHAGAAGRKAQPVMDSVLDPFCGPDFHKGDEHRLLSRSVEDSATVCSVLIPWNSCGMTQSTVLKVATLDYLPYCLFNIISPLMSIAVSIIGYRIYRATGQESSQS